MDTEKNTYTFTTNWESKEITVKVGRGTSIIGKKDVTLSELLKGFKSFLLAVGFTYVESLEAKCGDDPVVGPIVRSSEDDGNHGPLQLPINR